MTDRAAVARAVRSRLWLVGLLQSFLVALVATRALFAPGYLLHSDFITPLAATPTFFGRFLSSWDPVVGGFSYNTPKLSLQVVTVVLTALGASPAFVYKLVVVFILGLAGATMFHLVHRRVRAATTPVRAYAAASVGGFLFMLNPWVADKLHHHFWLVFGYALLPLVYLLYWRALDGRDGLRVLLPLSLLFVAEATQPHSLFIYVAPLLALVAVVHLLGDPSLRRAGAVLWTTGRLAVLSLLVNLFWVLPVASYFASATPSPGGYLLTVENVQILSRHATLLRASQLRSGFGMGGLLRGGFGIPYVTGTGWLDDLWLVAGFLLLGVALLGFVVDRVGRRRDRLALGVLFVASLVLLTGTKPPFGGLYEWAAVSLPAGWLVRDPFKFGGLFAFATAGLVGLSVADVLELLRTRQPLPRPAFDDGAATVVVVVLLLATGFHAWPMLTGDFNDHFEPTTVPDRYDRTLDWIDEHPPDGRVLWLPYQYISVDRPQVIKYRWTSGIAKYHVRGTKFLEFATPGAVMAQNPQNRPLLTWFHEGLRNGTLADPSAVLRGVGVSYVVFQRDLPDANRAPAIYERLTADPQITEVHGEGPLRVLRVANASLVRATGLVEADGYGPLDASMPRPAGGEPVRFGTGSAVRDGLLLTGGAPQRYLPVGTVIAPMAATDRHRPARRWSKARVDDPFQGHWHKYLANRGMTNWQTDFGRGMAFTWQPVRVPPGVVPADDERLARWTFDGDALPPGWTASGEGQSVSVADGELAVSLNVSTYGWKRVATPRLPADPDRVYRLAFDVTGTDVHGAHVKVSEYGPDGELLGVNRAGLVGSGDLNEEATVDYVPHSPNATAMRFELWHGHETTRPLPNRFRVDDVRVYNVTRYAEYPTLRTTFTVDDAGEYRIDGRFFANTDGGRVTVFVDGDPVDVETRAGFDTFVWSHLTTRNLSAGTHTLALENVYGFNAANLLTVAPTEAFERHQRELDRSLQDESVTYVLEAEGDLQRERSEPVSWATPAGGRDTGTFLDPGGRAWRTLDVVKSGWYDVSVRGSGRAVVRLDDRVYEFDRDAQGATDYGRVYLSRGRHRVAVEPVPTPLDATGFERPGAWSGGDPSFSVERTRVAASGDWSLRTETNRTDRGWSWVYTDPVSVTPQEYYGFSAAMRYWNANGSHVVVQGYDTVDERWRRLAVLGAGSSGYDSWRTYRTTLGVPVNVTEVRFALNGGWTVDSQWGPGATWFDDLHVEVSAPHAIDHVRLESAGDADDARGGGATVTDVERLGPTRYRVSVDASSPHVLAFAQDFDAQWVAEYDTPDGRAQVRPVQLYGAINGFVVNRTGEYTVTLRYRPQRWLVTGAVVSAATLAGCLGLLALRWRGRDARRRRFGRPVGAWVRAARRRAAATRDRPLVRDATARADAWSRRAVRRGRSWSRRAVRRGRSWSRRAVRRGRSWSRRAVRRSRRASRRAARRARSWLARLRRWTRRVRRRVER